MRLLLSYPMKVGTFYIGQSSDGRFHPIFDNESLDSYAEAWQASEDLANDAFSYFLLKIMVPIAIL